MARVYAKDEVVSGCLRGRRRPVAFARTPVAHVRVRARAVAYDFHYDTESGFAWAEVLDLRRAREGVTLPIYTSYEEVGRVQRLELAAGGSVAITSTHEPYLSAARQRPRGTEVRRSPGCGAEVLDDGSSVDAASLSIDGRSIRWRNGGEVRSAPLCPTHTVLQRVCRVRPGEEVVTVMGRAAVVRRPLADDDQVYRLCRGTARRHLAYYRAYGGEDGMRQIHAAGRWLAWTTADCDRYSGCNAPEVHVLDMVTGTRRQYDTRDVDVQIGITRGGVVVVAQGGDAPDVSAITASGPIVVSTGERVDGDSLLVGGGRAMWSAGGSARAAAVPLG